MKQIHYDMIGAYYYAKEHGVKDKHPQETMRELGLKLVISIPESIADCWNCLVEDFDFDLPDFIKVRDCIYWDYFYGFSPNKCIDAMIRCGVDYKAVVDKAEADAKKEQKRIAANRKMMDKLSISSVNEVRAFDTFGNVVLTIDDIDIIDVN